MNKKAQLKALETEIQQLMVKSKSDEGLTSEELDRVDEVSRSHETLIAEIAREEEMAERLNRMSKSAAPEQRSGAQTEGATHGTLGQAFVGSPALKSFRDSNRSGVSDGAPVSIEAKNLGGYFAQRAPLNTEAPGNAAPVRNGEVDDLTYRPVPSILNLVTRGTTRLPWFQYRQIIGKTNSASIVPESKDSTGAEYLKPLSTLETKLAEAREHTYADGMEVTNQELSDDGIIQTLIDSTLRENLDLYVANLLVNGAGTANEPAGILNTTGVLQQDFSTDPQETIRKAITKLRHTAGAPINGVLLNPADNEAWDLLKDADGRYLGAGPYAQGPSTAWGYQRIEDPSVPVGTAIMGDFRTIHFLMYEALSILAFNQHKDYAQRNLVYIRAEFRAVQLIRNAARLAVVDIAGV